MVGVNRVVVGPAVPNPVGDPSLEDPFKEKSVRRKLVQAALDLLQKDVEGTTIVTID